MNNSKWRYDYLVNQLHRTSYKKFETFIITSFLHDPDLFDLKPCLQFYARRSENKYALVDLYYPQIQVGIEIYETFHERQEREDFKRKSEIERYLNCRIYEIRAYEETIYNQIINVKTDIKNLINSRRDCSDWREWNEPASIRIDDIRKSYDDCLFVKIRGHISADTYHQRQTGTWKINWRWRPRIKRVVVVHNGEIVNVFKDIVITQNDGQKCRFSGNSDLTSELLGTYIIDWKCQQTITYSDNIRN